MPEGGSNAPVPLRHGPGQGARPRLRADHLGYYGKDRALSFLAAGDGYLAVNAQIRGRRRERPVTRGRDLPHRPSMCAMNEPFPSSAQS